MHLDENDAVGEGVAPEGVAPRDEGAPEVVADAVEGDERDADGRDGERRPRRRAEGFGETVQCRPLEVIVKDDRVEQAIRQLKNRLAREGVLRELKNRRHYYKPSELKRIKSREAARRRRKQARQRPRTK
jgi:small subunit ribosomal protein S21